MNSEDMLLRGIAKISVFAQDIEIRTLRLHFIRDNHIYDIEILLSQSFWINITDSNASSYNKFYPTTQQPALIAVTGRSKTASEDPPKHVFYAHSDSESKGVNIVNATLIGCCVWVVDNLGYILLTD